MKQRTKIIFLVYSALVIFMSSACIYMSHMIKSRYQDTSSEINIYKNVYVTNIEDNTITANMYGNIKKFNSGKIAEDVTGCLCDITVEDGKIVGVNTKTERIQQSSLVFQEQVRQHFQQILRDSLSVMMSMVGMTMAYSTSKVDATLRLSTLIRTQSQISTMQLRETLFLRTLHLMRMERLISQIRA